VAKVKVMVPRMCCRRPRFYVAGHHPMSFTIVCLYTPTALCFWRINSFSFSLLSWVTNREGVSPADYEFLSWVWDGARPEKNFLYL